MNKILLLGLILLIPAFTQAAVSVIQPCNVTNEMVINTTIGNFSNVTTEYCTYCNPLFIERTGPEYSCTDNNTQYRFYDDYSTCCALSPINCIYPADHNTQATCGYYPTNLTCLYDAKPYLTEKINIACYLPAPYANETFDCITYVRKANQTLLIQSNPEYTDASNIAFWKESERRHSFTNTGALINAQYTNKNLETGQPFILGMTCTNRYGLILTSEYSITPTYQAPTTFINRLVWASDNWTYVLIWILGVVIIILSISWALHKMRRR